MLAELCYDTVMNVDGDDGGDGDRMVMITSGESGDGNGECLGRSDSVMVMVMVVITVMMSDVDAVVVLMGHYLCMAATTCSRYYFVVMLVSEHC